jgi:hypothetical protein
MRREIAQCQITLVVAAFRIGLAQQSLRARLVKLRIEVEISGIGFVEPRDRPAGQDARERRDIVLRIAAIDAERVQLHHLAREVLVEPDMAALAGLRIRADRQHLIEIEQHRRMAFDGEQHVDKAPGDVRPNRFALERAGEAANDRPDTRDRKVIAPEARHPLQERRIAGNRRVVPRRDLSEIDRAEPFVLGFFRIVGLVLSRVLAVLQHFRDHRRGGRQTRIERCRPSIELLQYPTARIAGNRLQLAGRRREAEARRRHECVG